MMRRFVGESGEGSGERSAASTCASDVAQQSNCAMKTSVLASRVNLLIGFERRRRRSHGGAQPEPD